jgi:HEAT repeat protein
MANVFISYSRKSIVTAREVHKYLAACHFFVWIDYDAIQGGNLWEDKIHEGLSICNCLTVLVDEYSIESEWVKTEVAYAVERGISIFPLIIRPLDSIDSALKKPTIDNIQAIDLIKDANALDHLKTRIIEQSRNDRKFFKLMRDIRREGWDNLAQELIDMLADLQDRRATYYLIKILEQDDEFASVRWSAANALGKLKDVKAIPALKQVIFGEESEWRSEDEDDIKSECIIALGQIGGLDALNIVCKALHINNLVLDAIQTLAHFRHAKAAKELCKMLNYQDEKLAKLWTTDRRIAGRSAKEVASRLRIEIVKSLSKIADRTSVPPLVKLLRNHSELDTELIEAVMDTFEEIDSPEAIDILKEIVNTSYPHEIRGKAIVVLGYIGNETLLEFIINLLDDVAVIPYAAEALEAIGDQRAVQPLLDQLVNLSSRSNYEDKIPKELHRVYFIDTLSALQHALFSLGHKIDPKRYIIRSHVD